MLYRSIKILKVDYTDFRFDIRCVIPYLIYNTFTCKIQTMTNI